MTYYTCEATLEAMLSCIYDAWISRKGHQNICLLLEQCSFDVEAFFNYLKYKEKVNEEEAKAKFLFTSADDYIILKMKDSDLYNEMINLKGEDAIQRRLLFLTKEI